jgi:hypothetical protein
MYPALALHDLAGWPIYAEVADDGRIIHACAAHAGKAVDISGVHPKNFAPAPGPDKRRDGKASGQSLTLGARRLRLESDP